MERWAVRSSPPPGMALPLVLLLLLALAAFGHGALLLSQRELRATWAFRSLVQAEQAAEIGLRLALEISPDQDVSRTPWTAHGLLSGETEDGLIYEASRRWLSDEFYLLEGRGRIRDWVGEREIGWIGWSRFPGVRLETFLGAAGGVSTLPINPDSTRFPSLEEPPLLQGVLRFPAR
jgi:hypothetical protein